MQPRTPLSLPRRYLAIVALPVTVYFFSEWLLWYLGRTEAKIPAALVFDPHEEAAARYRVLGTYLLVISAASAAIGYFLYSLARLTKWSRKDALFAFAVTIGITFALLSAVQKLSEAKYIDGGVVRTQEMMGAPLVVAALSQRDEQRHPIDAPKPTTDGAASPIQGGAPLDPKRLADDGSAAPPVCNGLSPDTDYRLLRCLIDSESYLLLLAIPSLAFGTILSLAWPARRLYGEEEKALRDEQIGRLNTFLYLSALMLVAGLLFLSAFLHWPLFALPDEMRAAYREHVHAVVLFNGVTYTVLLASYYLPAAGLLARRWRYVKPSEGESGEMLDWRGFLKAALAVFAPLVVGLLGEVMKIPLASG